MPPSTGDDPGRPRSGLDAAGPDTPDLDAIALLRDLSLADRDRLAGACRWRKVAPRQQIIDSEADTQETCFIVSGAVRVVNYSASGREISFADLRAGATVGELSAIDGEPRSASVFALEETLLASLAPGPFRALIGAHPDVALRIMRNLAGMVRDASRRIMDLSTLGAHNRVHGELLRLAREGRRDGEIVIIEPAPPHADIAARVSTTRETVARVLGNLARERIVTRRGRALAVLDLERLAALVDDPREA